MNIALFNKCVLTVCSLCIAIMMVTAVALGRYELLLVGAFLLWCLWQN